jgi:hypothetical protein
MIAGPAPQRLARLIAPAGFVAMLAAAVLLPVYSDEIGWRFQERAAIDGGIDVMFNDLCGPNALGHPPLIMMPVRWFSALANRALADPAWVRVEGVLCALLWARLLWLVIARVVDDPDRRAWLIGFAYTLCGLGVLPFLLALSRPEQPVLLAYTQIILLGLGAQTTHRPGPWLRCGAIALLVLIASSYHLKGVLYAPIAFVCLALLVRGAGTVWPRLIAGAATLAITLTNAHYWLDHLRCVAGDPRLAAHYARENLAEVLTGPHPASGLIAQLASGFNPFNYIALALAGNRSMSHWLPDGRFSPAAVIAIDAVLLVVWLIALVLAAKALWHHLRNAGIAGLLQGRVALACTILGCVTLWGASQIRRNDYEAAHVLPMLIMACVLCLSLDPDKAGALPRRAGRAILAAATAALIGQALVIAAMFPAFATAARAPGYIDDMPFSVSVGHYSAVRSDIFRAMAAAQLPRDHRLHRLLIDDVTYLALQDSDLPLHRLGVLQVWNDGIDDPVAYLISRGSEGVVVGCRYLPPVMRDAAARSGQVCALSAADLQRLAQRSPADRVHAAK